MAAGSSPTQAAIKVGSDTFTSTPIASGQGAFFVLVLDAGQLTFLSADTFVVSGIAAADAANNLRAMDAILENAASTRDELTFIQTVGAVQRLDGDPSGIWNTVAHDQTLMGGSELYLNALDGSQAGGTYAFVGVGEPPSLPSPWALTASALATRSAGQLAGLLGRNTQSQFYPKVAGPTASFDVELPGVAYRRPVAWPDRDTDGHNAAIACIAASLKPALKTLPIEANYSNENLPWGSYETQLTQLSFSSLPDNQPCQGGGFTQQDFSDVSSQLGTEWAYLQTVENLIANLKAPLLGGYSTTNAHIGDIVQAITNEINAPASTAATDAREIGIDTLYVASSIPEIGDIFGLAASLDSLANQLSNDQDGAPQISTFQVAANDLPDGLGNRYQVLLEGIDGIGDILKGDWGKLETAANLAAGSWAWDSTVDYGHARDALDNSLKKWAWDTVFPVGYDVYGFSPEVADARTWTCTGFSEIDPSIPTKFQPFANLPGGGISVVTGAGPTTDLRAFGKVDEGFLVQDDNDRDSNGTPSQGLIDDMFTTVDENSTVPIPAEPSQVRFLVDNYAAEHIITLDDSGVCYVDGKVPGGD
jgi:hypothetical protein